MTTAYESSRLASPTVISLQVHGPIESVLLAGEAAEPAVEPCSRLAEGIRREVGEDAAVVAPARMRPGDEDVGKIGGVVGDRYPWLVLREREEDLVVELFEIVSESGRENVVSRALEEAHEPVARQIGVEKKSKRLTGRQLPSPARTSG